MILKWISMEGDPRDIGVIGEWHMENKSAIIGDIVGKESCVGRVLMEIVSNSAK